MHETAKVEEAEYFLKQMADCEEDRQAYKYNLSAFLQASRSVLQFAHKECQPVPVALSWYESQVGGNRLVQFFKDRRDVSIHEHPIRPIMELKASIEETIHLGFAADAVVIRDGKVVPSEGRPIAGFPVGTNWPYPSRVIMGGAYKFSEWRGDDDVPTLCRQYLDELKQIIADGQSKGYLPTQ